MLATPTVLNRAWHQQITAYLNVDPTTALALMGLVEIENDVTP
jgi:hypothetical protein